MDGVGDFRLVDREVVRLREEVVRRVLGFRRQRLAAPEFRRIDAPALWCPGPGRRVARVHHQDAGNQEVVDVPAIDQAGPLLHGGDERWGLGVQRPSRHAHAVVQAFHLRWIAGVVFAATERARMHEWQVREVQQVVADQEVVDVVVQIARQAAPVGMVEPRRRRDGGRVRLLRSAHPDPDPAMLRHHRECAHTGARRHLLSPWGIDALAAGVELQAVIVAAYAVALEAALRQRRATVAAAVLERNQLTVGLAVDHDRDAADRAGEALGRDLMVPSDDIPGVSNEAHDSALNPVRRTTSAQRSKSARITLFSHCASCATAVKPMPCS